MSLFEETFVSTERRRIADLIEMLWMFQFEDMELTALITELMFLLCDLG